MSNDACCVVSEKRRGAKRYGEKWDKKTGAVREQRKEERRKVLGE